MGTTAEFDAAWERANADPSIAQAEWAAALPLAREGFRVDPDLWLMRMRMAVSKLEDIATSPEVRAASEEAVHEILAYGRAGAESDPQRRDLLVTMLNSHSMRLESEGRLEESLAIASEQRDLAEADAVAAPADGRTASILQHARDRLAELRLATGDAVGALEIANALVATSRANGEDPSQAPSGLPAWLELRARALAAVGDVAQARAEFETALEWKRARVRTGRFFLAHLDLAEALDEYAAMLRGMGDEADALAAEQDAERVRVEKTA